MNTKNSKFAGYVSWKLMMALLLLAMLAGFALRMAMHRMAYMTVLAGSVKDLQQAKPDERQKLVVEVEEGDQQGTVRGKLLQKKTEEIYNRTSTEVVVRAGSDTKMVMGSRDDIRKSAVIHVTGTVCPDRSIAAEQIVILTAYVKVQ